MYLSLGICVFLFIGVISLHEVSNVIQYSGGDFCDIYTALRISDDYNISVGSGH